ncbi:MAG TPA: hypothetical protein VHW23_09260, partial [Kofleriaceae bacterium]|nr:hypothetical protein [Kofleriaceae bacterium]
DAATVLNHDGALTGAVEGVFETWLDNDRVLVAVWKAGNLSRRRHRIAVWLSFSEMESSHGHGEPGHQNVQGGTRGVQGEHHDSHPR